MKKFYAIVTAAIMSISLFAQQPSASDLAAYQKADHYVACFSTPADATCNEIAWVGTYNSWNLQDPDILICEPLPGFDGWYVVVVPVDAEGKNEGKPVQRNECGKLNWTYQCGNADAISLVSGSVTIEPNGAECNLKGWSTEEPTIITMTAWKNGVNPCTATCKEIEYTFRVYDPYCDENPDLEPTLKGSWDWDAAAKTMEFKDSYYEAKIVVDPATLEFKFNNDPAGSWDNQFQYFVPEDEENDVPAKWVNFENFKLDPADPQSVYYTLEGTIITFDFSDTEKFRYASCGSETGEFEVTVNLKTTADAPAAGVEMAGSFASTDWSVFQPMELKEGVYTATLTTEASKEFKFREAGSWDNEIVTKADGKALANLKFGDVWKDAGEGKKVIDLDYSDANVYCWKANWTEGIENVVLTEKAQKVVVDGNMYIIRDNKMFNVQGAQVR